MYKICESDNFIWSKQNYLGEDATAMVYQGAGKLTGDLVAVKCYKTGSTQPKYELRELELLKKVKHENIVKLIAIDESLADRKKVIVMELCNGGNLLDDLMDPKNMYGLEESEFLLVLKHLYSGMKYLRDNNIIHGDLQPGNIMKCIQEDGTNIYKLTKFGAAREMTERETFQSLCGTEQLGQYLHPDVYEQAVLARRANTKFNSSVDLWSIGVTLYHIATGILPFKAYDGYKNKETMHYITTKKDSGVISGIQTREHGPITWNRNLPNSCLLSDTLKKNITPILAGVMESNHSKIWGFDKFFYKVDILLSHIGINIFYANKAKRIKIYMLRDQNYKDLEQYITDETEIVASNQILLYKTNYLKDFVQEFGRVCEYPKTTEDHPLFLFNKAKENFSVVPILIPEWMDFPTHISVENDVKPAAYACMIGHYCKRQIDKYSLYCKLLNDSVETLIDYFDRDIKYMQLKAQHLFEKIRIYEKTAEMLPFFPSINKCNSNCESKLENISKEFATAKKLITNSYNLQWDSTVNDLIHPCKSYASEKGKTQIDEMRKSWQYFVKEPLTADMSNSKSQWHILERKIIKQKLNNITTLLKVETFPQYQQTAKGFENWFNSAQIMCSEANALKSEIEQSEQRLKAFENELTVAYDDYVKNEGQLRNHDLDAEK